MLNIRQFRADDLEALYGISLATGLAGGDASHLYADSRLMGHIYAAPYALLEPQLALVVEDGEDIAGFAVGTTDTTAWEQRLEQVWWPSLRERYAMPAETEASGWTHDQRRAFMIHRPTHTPPPRCPVLSGAPPYESSPSSPQAWRRNDSPRLLDIRRERSRRKGHSRRDQPGQ